MVSQDVIVVGQGVATVTPLETSQGLTRYKLEAAAAAGYRFDQWYIEQTIRIVSEGGAERVDTYTKWSSDNPYEARDFSDILVDGTFVIYGVETWYITLKVWAYFLTPGIIYDPLQNNGIMYDATTGLPLCYV